MIVKKLEIPITEKEQSAFCTSEENLTTKPLADEYKINIRWQKIPTTYVRIPPPELIERIKIAKQTLNKKVIILGHHYQRDDVIQFSDLQGDSYKLAKFAAEQKADFIVFCGVHFMAETADILSSDSQRVILPNLSAGCSMSDMAPTDMVKTAWNELEAVFNSNKISKKETTLADLIPITYMNSAAAIKALVGENGGICCTSSNAGKAMRWAFERGSRILFIPDKNLGYNTARQLGFNDDEMLVWKPGEKLGGNSEKQLLKSKIILWAGYCSVHSRIERSYIEKLKRERPKAKIIVHPECTPDVVEIADAAGSTEAIAKYVREAPTGSSIGIGTEVNMVKRLANNNPDKTIFSLESNICPCTTMYRIHPAYLLWVLEGLVNHEANNVIAVPPEIKEKAKLCLSRMLEV